MEKDNQIAMHSRVKTAANTLNNYISTHFLFKHAPDDWLIHFWINSDTSGCIFSIANLATGKAKAQFYWQEKEMQEKWLSSNSKIGKISVSQTH